MLAQSENSHFLCLSVAILDTETAELMVCTAGMDPPIIVRVNESESNVTPLESNGMLLGVTRGVEYKHVNHTLGQGDLFIFTTDGITEARPKGGRVLGIEKLIDIVKGCDVGDTLTSIGETIFADATKYAGGTLTDDACVLIARRL